MILISCLTQMPKYKYSLILIALAVADLLGAIDSTSVNIALPRIRDDLGISILKAQWIPNAFTLALVTTLILFGKIGDKYGYKKVYIIGLIIFGLSSLVLVLSEIPDLIIIARMMQGFSTAILYTMPMAIIAHLWKEKEKAFAVTSSIFALGMLIGPLIGGVFSDITIHGWSGWHLIFLVNIPLVLAGILTTIKCVPTIPKTPAIRINVTSVLLLILGIGLCTLSFSVLNSYFFLIGLVFIILLILVERKADNHLIDLTLFNRTFSSVNIISFVMMVSVIGMSYVLTFYLQDNLGWSSTKTGMSLLPVPIITGIFSIVGGRIKNWRIAGFMTSISVFLGMLLLSTIPENSINTYWRYVFPGLAFVSAGSGILMSSLFAAMISSVPKDKSGNASGVINTIQQLGALLGIAIIAGIVMRFRLSFGSLSIIALVGVMASFFVTNNNKISSEHPLGEL